MKVIGSDYDGTLNHNGIDAKKKNAINKWREAGNIFAVISGRGAKDLFSLYRKVNWLYNSLNIAKAV